MATIHYHVHPGQGPYLLMVHGFLSSNSQWLANIDALGQVCTPVTAELWGHGKSPSPSAVWLYEPEQYVSQFEIIRKALSAEQWFVCGYSLGAALTARYSCIYPERVKGHIMTNSNSAFANTEQVEEWKKTAEKSGRNIENGGLSAIEKIPVHPKFAKTLPKQIYNTLLADSKSLNPIGIANTLRRTTPNACIRDLAINNRSPALLCWGNREKRFVALKEWAETNMPNLQISAIEAGHAVNMQDAEAFNLAVGSFIRQCDT